MSQPEQGNINYILDLPLENILSPDVLILESDKTAADATNLMKEKDARSKVAEDIF